MSEPSHDRRSGWLRLRRWGRGVGRSLLWGCALAFILQVAGAYFGWHRIPLRWLSAASEEALPPPSLIVVLGGGGIPSESGLMRTYHGAELALQHPEADVIVSLPTDFDPDTTSVGRMRDELVMRGVPAARIRMETRALNTYEQAVEIKDMLDAVNLTDPVWVVTSPSHMRRSLMCFQQVGFTRVYGTPARVVGPEADIGGAAFWRYSLWAHLEMQVRIVRELVALGVYRARGWV